MYTENGMATKYGISGQLVASRSSSFDLCAALSLSVFLGVWSSSGRGVLSLHACLAMGAGCNGRAILDVVDAQEDSGFGRSFLQVAGLPGLCDG